MKVKVGDTWFSTDDQPIAVMFDDEELELVKEMNRETCPNLRFGTGFDDPVKLLEWMRE
ncbi:hypothetical protein [Pseudomonas sp. LP_4_YM]|uniref:hypothetical protein n=1 Tax=Pseudomonas sp. LP_4_YM TaxID=2485135 RepID=UPI0010EEF1BA|nr:hypothetical protein [Pseudomonas sp. LP_4_YM]TCT93287.1 hypothetical protein EC913_116103 [Pseudomonas sp. LP_4_YM]